MSCEQPESYEDLNAVARVVKGDERFARIAFERAAEPERPRTWSVERLARVVAGRAGVDIEEMRGRAFSTERAQARAMIGYVARRIGRIPLTKVAEFCHRDGTTLVRDFRRFEAELAARCELRKELAAILRELSRS